MGDSLSQRTLDLVVFGHNDWWVWEKQGFSLRNAALVRALAKRPEVASVAVVDSPRFFRRAHRPVDRRHEDVSAVADKVVAVRWSFPLPLPSAWAAGRRLNERLSAPALARRLARALRPGGRRVLWVADPRLGPEATRLTHDLAVFDAIDDWRFHRWAGRSAVRRGYHWVSERADLVLAVNGSLLDQLAPRGRAVVLPNAIDAASWSDVAPDATVTAGLSRPIVGYVGTLQGRVDFDLLFAVARALPRASFLLVGPVFGSVRSQVERAPANVRAVGAVSHARVPAIVAALDVAIVPHHVEGIARSMDPLKMYEYLAAGRPVVSTLAPPNRALADYVRVATDAQGFATAIAEEEAQDDEPRRQTRRQAVRGETWEARAERVLALIDEGLARGASRT